MAIHPVLEFTHVHMHFGDAHALKDVSFRVRSGEVFGLVGPRGSGKTTAVRILLGCLPVTAGMVRLLGSDPLQGVGRVASQVGVVLGHHRYYRRLTAADHLDLYAGLFDMTAPQVRQRRDELLDLVGLSDCAHELVRTFSRSMRQRLTFARALLSRPRLLILDEPFEGIDFGTRQDLLAVIETVAKQDDIAVFLTAQDLAEVQRAGQRAVCLPAQTILADALHLPYRVRPVVSPPSSHRQMMLHSISAAPGAR